MKDTFTPEMIEEAIDTLLGKVEIVNKNSSRASIHAPRGVYTCIAALARRHGVSVTTEITSALTAWIAADIRLTLHKKNLRPTARLMEKGIDNLMQDAGSN